MKHVLFVCSQARLRSPTAEQLFSGRPDLECASAGTNHDADSPLTAELIQWADIIFVMERAHRRKLTSRFGRDLSNKRVVCLDVPDDYEYMEPELVTLLREKLSRLLPDVHSGL